MAGTSWMEKAIGKSGLALFAFAFGGAINLATAYVIMLALGVAHDQWPQVPAFGFWATWLLLIGVASFAGAIHGGMRIKQVKQDS